MRLDSCQVDGGILQSFLRFRSLSKWACTWRCAFQARHPLERHWIKQRGGRQTEQAASLGVVCSYPCPEIKTYSLLNVMSCAQSLYAYFFLFENHLFAACWMIAIPRFAPLNFCLPRRTPGWFARLLVLISIGNIQTKIYSVGSYGQC